MIEVFYFFFFQSVAINMAYMPSHLRALGLTGRQVSTALAVAPILSLGVPLGWAWLADRTRRHDRVLRIVACGAWLGFSPLVFVRGAAAGRFSVILAGYVGYAIFNVGMGGMADALAVVRVRAGAIYGRMRLWGSVGFVVAAVVTGAALGIFSSPSFSLSAAARLASPSTLAGPLIPLGMWLTLGGAFWASTRLRGGGEEATRPHAADFRALLAAPGLRLLLLAGALHWACMAPYNVFLGVFLRDLGLPPVAWGLAYSIGVIAEMLVLLYFHRLHARFNLDTLLAVAFVASALRWLAVSRVHSPAALILLQSLHGMTFGMFWSAAIALVAATVPPPLRATGQALLVMSINLGGAIGNLVTGALYDVSGPRTLFLLAAIGEVLPLLVVLRARHHLRAAMPNARGAARAPAA
jgi:MFS transporter, PPP family, 3-phenylpropionic acid transporter